MALGPLHYMVITFAEDGLLSDVVSELCAVRAGGLIRLVDLLFVTRTREGATRSIELSDLGGHQLGDLAAMLGEVIPGWAGADPYLEVVHDGTVRGFTEDDVRELAAAVPTGSSAAIVLFEHTWARGLAEALERAGGAISSEAVLSGGRVFSPRVS
jgi:Family of unknown function (DUF6325)